MKVCIITDDNAGFTKEEAKELGIYVVPMPIIVNGDIFYENVSITEDKFYQLQAEGADIKTSQPAPGEIIKVWDEMLKKYDQIVHIPMSSGLSKECETAKMLAQDYPGKVFVCDNHRISVTLKTSIRDAVKLAKEGKSGEEIKKIIEEESYNSSIYIMVDTLKYLKKGGRVTAAGALLGAALHIKPILTIQGMQLDAFQKAIGTKKAKSIMINAIKSDYEKRFSNLPKESLVYQMAYTYDLDEALAFKKEFCEALNLKEDEVEMNPLALSIATHIGPGSLAVTISKKL